MEFGRRAFLRMGVAGLACGAASSIGLSAMAQDIEAPAVIGKAACRAVALQNLHTGEKVALDYWADGAYMPGAMREIDRVLRDWRTGETKPVDPKLIDLLHALHGKLECGDAFQIICGYRSPKTNAILHAKSSGVAEKSLHIQAKAIDLKVASRDLSQVRAAALALGLGGVGFYPVSDFVHVDTGAVRQWVGS